MPVMRQVLVMDAGVVAEFDTVPTLLANPESAFKAMVVEAGLHDEDIQAVPVA